MTKTEAKRKAQDLILDQLAKIGYGDEYEDFIQEVSPDNPDEAVEILKSQIPTSPICWLPTSTRRRKRSESTDH